MSNLFPEKITITFYYFTQTWISASKGKLINLDLNGEYELNQRLVSI